MHKKIKINHLIFDKIKFRYDFFNEGSIWDRTRQNKLLLDTFYPHALCKNIVTPTKAPLMISNQVNGYAISERVSEDLGVKKLHISELITMLGYTKTDITKLLQAAKNRGFNLALVGLGGTGSNFLHWLYEMSEWTGKTEIFPKITGFDDDDYDIPNMLRIPFIPDYMFLQTSSKKAECMPRKFKQIAATLEFRNEKMTLENLVPARVGAKTKTIVYGAPDIGTREWLSAHEDYTFIAATHRDSEFSLVENPAVDNELMMETYGKINLSKFYLNHLTMTIKFLEHVRDRTTGLCTTAEERLVESNFDAIYEAQLANGFKAGSKKLFAIDATRTTPAVLELGA